MILYTTLTEIKKHNPCSDGYKRLLKYIGTDYPIDQPIDILTILQSNGLDDTTWVLRAAMPEADRDRISRLFACDCAEAVRPLYEEKYPNDNRPRKAIEVARRYALGQATKDELKEASDAAAAAVGSADAAADAAYWSADTVAFVAAFWSVNAVRDAAVPAAHLECAKQTKILFKYLGGES